MSRCCLRRVGMIWPVDNGKDTPLKIGVVKPVTPGVEVSGLSRGQDNAGGVAADSRRCVGPSVDTAEGNSG